MPCYLFTFHAHGSWLPDRPRGYVKRGRGILPTDHVMAARYGENLKQRVAVFDDAVQQILVAVMHEASAQQNAVCHAIATDISHAHVLISWRHDRTWELVRRQTGSAATRALNAAFLRRRWFAKSPSRRQVRDRKHFDYLVQKYLPKHQGLKWSETRGLYS